MITVYIWLKREKYLSTLPTEFPEDWMTLCKLVSATRFQQMSSQIYKIHNWMDNICKRYQCPRTAIELKSKNRPGWTQGLLYKHRCNSLIHSFIRTVSDPFPQLTLRSPGASGLRVLDYYQNIDYDAQVQGILNSEEFENCSTRSKFEAILPDRPNFA